MFRKRFLLSVAVFLLTTSVWAQTRMGLHFTKEELTIWRIRTRNAPYITAGDAQVNSPGDWERIVKNANILLDEPTADQYTNYYKGKGCVVPQENSSNDPQSKGSNLRDAGFYYLLTGDSRYASAVRSILLAEANNSMLDFTNTKRWCPGGVQDLNPGFGIAEWLTRLLYGYDYIKATLSTSDKTTLNAWFLGAARYLQSNYDPSLDDIFVDRAAGDYTIAHYWMAEKEADASDGKLMYYGGPKARTISRQYNNRRATMASFVGLAGIFLRDNALKLSSKRFFKELLMFGIYSSGYHVDFLRGISDKSPDKGYGYATLSTMFVFADALARTGDTELYDWTTKGGTTSETSGNGATTDGEKAKGIKMHIKAMLDVRNHNKAIYATTDASEVGNSAYRVDGEDVAKGAYTVWDVIYAVPNLYYKDSYIRASYLRTANGAVPYPKVAQNSGPCIAWTLGQYPGVLLMFGQMEGKVWPYPSEQETPSWPTNRMPTITMITPTDNSNYIVGADIHFNVEVDDRDGSVAKVEFFNGSTKIGEALSSPFSFTWKNAPGGEYVFSAKVTDEVGGSATSTANVSLSANCSATGSILMETWKGVNGSLVRYIPLDTSPDTRNQLTVFEAPSNDESYYGNRVSGYICPPITGKYTFWITSDGQGELWLSPGTDPAKKRKIAYSDFATNTGEWNKYPSQKSVSINLVAGQSYYIEALRKVSKTRASTNLTVSWQLPDGTLERPISGERLSEFPPDLNNVRPTVALTSLDYGDQFIANKDIFIAADASDSDGKLLRVEFFNGSVKLGEDLDSPYTFTWEGVAAGNYTIRAKAIDNTGASTLSNPRPILVGESDCSDAGTISWQAWSDIAGKQLSEVAFNAAPSRNQELSSFEEPLNLTENYGSRLRGYLCPPLTGDYVFWIASDDEGELWLSTDDDPANKELIASVSNYTFFREWSKYPTQQSKKIRLIAGKRYYVEALHKQALSYSHLSVGWQLPDLYNTLERPIPGKSLLPFSSSNNSRLGLNEELSAEEVTDHGVAELSASPNPFSNELFIKMKIRQAGDVRMDLFDMKGNLVRHIHEGFSNTDEGQEFKLESNGLKPGMYLIRLVTQKSSVYKKVLLVN